MGGIAGRKPEVGAGQAGCVGGMDDDGAVTEEAGGTLAGGGIEIKVGNLESTIAGNVTVLAAEVSDLTGLRCGRIARGLFTADVRVEVREGSGAVTGGGDGLVVDVVLCEAQGCQQSETREQPIGFAEVEWMTWTYGKDPETGLGSHRNRRSKSHRCHQGLTFP